MGNLNRERVVVVVGASEALEDCAAALAADCNVERLDELGETGVPGAELALLDAGASAADVRAARGALGVPIALVAPRYDADLVERARATDADTVFWLPLDPAQITRFLSAQPACGSVATKLVMGQGSPMEEVLRAALLAARGSSSVLIAGETGVGKEVVAGLIHRFSPRRRAPFKAVNCAAIPDTLLESELFGHEVGAFTGATRARRGRFELADGGTLLLDEVAELPYALQGKLLRVLQEGRVDRLGAEEPTALDVRVIAATNVDLGGAVAEGRFRADLLYRLNITTIEIPPLRERRADIPALWQAFLEQACAREGREPPETTAGVEGALLRHPWPGNVRELANAAEHALMVGRGDVIEERDLPPSLRGAPDRAAVPSLVGMSLEEIERLAITQTVEALPTVKRAAEVLGVSARKLHYRLKEYREEAPAPALEPSDGLRVLLAEDDPELRWALSEFLTRRGHHVVPIPDGRAVLEHFGARMLLGEPEETHPDLIISDVQMPGLTGLELLEHARKRGWQIPVVLITGYGDVSLRRDAERLGATAVLDKPIDLEQLTSILGGEPAKIPSSAPRAPTRH